MEPGGRQWVAYRVVPGTLLAAPLPSAPEVGDGWRGVDLRKIHPLGQFDPLVIETGTRSEAALGIHVEDSVAYVLAAARDRPPVRLVFAVDPARPSERASAVLAHAGATEPFVTWRADAAEAFAAWSALAPRTLDPSAVLAHMGPEHPPVEAVSWIAALLGLRAPDEPIPDPLDLQSVARRQLKGAPKAGKRRWFSRDG